MAGNRSFRYLTAWSILAAATWAYAFVVCAIFNFDDLIKDQAWHAQDGAALSAMLIGFSQAAVASKFYQTVLARLTVRGIVGRWSAITEICMRGVPLVALPTVVLASNTSPSSGLGHVLWAPCSSHLRTSLLFDWRDG